MTEQDIRQKLSLSDDFVFFPIQLNDILVLQDTMYQMQQKAKLIAQEYEYPIDLVLKSLTKEALLGEDNRLIVIVILPKSQHLFLIDSDSWKFITPPTFH